MSERYVPVYIRTWPDRYRISHKKRFRRFSGGLILTLDCETTTDETQRLLFGFYRLSSVKVSREAGKQVLTMVTQHEGIFYADDLAEVSPAWYQFITKYLHDPDKYYSKTNRDLVSAATYDDERAGLIDVEPNSKLECLTLSEFVRDYLLTSAYLDMPGKRTTEPATIVGFNLPFDMWRLVSGVTEGRGSFYGCFSGEFLGGKVTGADGQRSSQFIPNYNEKPLGAKGMLMRFTGNQPKDEKPGKQKNPTGYFVDLSVAMFGLYARTFNLRDAGETMGCTILKSDELGAGHGQIPETYQDACQYLDYARQDVAATENLYKKVMEEFLRHPVSMSLEELLSPASMAKQYLRDMGITGVLAKSRKFPKSLLGRCMAAFYGGRAECKFRMKAVKAALLDFTSMYPTVMILIGVWEMLTSKNIRVEYAPDEIQDLLRTLTVSDLFKPSSWRLLAGVAEIEPNGDLLPVRSNYSYTKDKMASIGINHLTSDTPLTYTLFDLAASKILTGKVPVIRHAWRFHPSDKKQAGLKPLALYDDPTLTVDPSQDNLLKMAVEQKQLAKRRHPKTKPDDDVIENCGCSDCRAVDRTQAVLTKSEAMSHEGQVIQAVLSGKPAHTVADWFARIREDLARFTRERDLIHKNSAQRQSWNVKRDKCRRAACCATERFLKIFVNAIYGIFAEMNSQKRSAGNTVDSKVFGVNGKSWNALNAEQPGEFCFPPFAAMITGGARLMLAMLQKCVEDAGGTHIFCDTDSLCIAASKQAGMLNGIEHLSYEQIESIRLRFNELNPYDPDILPDLLKWDTPDSPEDPEVYCFAISSKRYALYRLWPCCNVETGNLGEAIEIVKRSEHGLGLYLNPKSKRASGPEAKEASWITETWEWIIRTYALGEKAARPEWFSRPAATRLTITTPELLKPFESFNEGYPYTEQVKPHNFMLTFHPLKLVRLAYPNMRLVAPLSDPEYWQEYSVFNLHGERGLELYITTDHDSWDGEIPSEDDLANWKVPVKTYRNVIRDYVRHPEIKYDDQDGNACHAETTGRLQPCRLVATEFQQIGKDASSIPQEITESIGFTYHSYGGTDLYPPAVSILKGMAVSGRELSTMLAEFDVEVAVTSARNYLSGRTSPRQETKTAIIKLAGDLIYPKLDRESLGNRRRWQLPESELFARWSKETASEEAETE